MDFEKPGIGAQFSQLGYLLKNTFTIIGRDKDILSPIIRMSIYATLVVVLFFAGVAAIVVGMGGTGTLLLLAMVVAFIYKFFYYNHQELRLSRLIYDTAYGRDATLQNVRKELADLKGRARILGLIDMAGAWGKAFQEHCRITECALRLGPGGGDRLGRIGHVGDKAHPAPAASGAGLDQKRRAERLGFLQQARV